jgi:hypothetical protein
MRERYAGYLYEAKGTWLRPDTRTEEGFWRIELDCGVSRNVYLAAFVDFELTELPQGVLYGENPVRVRGRIESFGPGIHIHLGRGKLFT